MGAKMLLTIKHLLPADVHVAYNYLTNRQVGDSADANGNIGSANIYDLENRLVQPSGSTARYGYDANNKRVWRGDTGVDEIAFWAGQKLATYQISNSGGNLYFTLTSTRVYFGSKLISTGTYNSSGSGDMVTLAPVVADRLGSIKKFYPYGTERPSASANDTEKFTGYYRDASTGLDYADQRYHQPGVGRFMTADPANSSANANDPGSWNRYAYVEGDPVNRTDPRGLEIRDCDWDGGCLNPSGPVSFEGQGSSIGVSLAGPLWENEQRNEATYLSYVRGAFGGWVAGDSIEAVLQAVAVTMEHQIVDAARPIAQHALEAPNCAGLFNLPSGVTPWLVFSSQVKITFNPEDDLNTFATTLTANGTTTINFNTDPANVSLIGTFQHAAASAADTMVHELIHAVEHMYGANAVAGAIRLGWVIDDNTGNKAQDTESEIINNRIVAENCFQ